MNFFIIITIIAAIFTLILLLWIHRLLMDVNWINCSLLQCLSKEVRQSSRIRRFRSWLLLTKRSFNRWEDFFIYSWPGSVKHLKEVPYFPQSADPFTLKLSSIFSAWPSQMPTRTQYCCKKRPRQLQRPVARKITALTRLSRRKITLSWKPGAWDKHELVRSQMKTLKKLTRRRSKRRLASTTSLYSYSINLIELLFFYQCSLMSCQS